jgi:uncharacterized membrane protein YqjE
MDLTRTATRLEPARIESGLPPRRDESLGDLAHQLAQQGVELAAVELRRLGAEVRERRRHAVRAAVALYLSGVAGALTLAVLSGAAILYLGRRWNDYAAAAGATGALLLLITAVAAGVLIGALRRTGASSTRGDDRETAAPTDERNPRHAA